ncbi:hypothetical protein [Streptomyces sp. NBC_01320]|uniref:hypothetical protein n=1 Tax=Streptomyces sp. NBC_01320 TaxID=2903824 RepID=UPI002E1662F7|nr:hypothetical protein OG395_05390 [Streptomyces sp. NBC_01320]
MPTLIMRAVPSSETASANGINTLLRSVGTSLASAVVAAMTTTYLLGVGAESYTHPDALIGIFWASAAMCLGTIFLTVPMFALRDYSQRAFT